MSFWFEWEVQLILFLQKVCGSGITKVLMGAADLGDEAAMILVIGIVYWGIDKKLGKRMLLNLAVVNVAYPMLKNIVMRRRPYMDHPDIVCKKKVADDADLYDIAAQGYSFPSGHAANSTAVYGTLYTCFKRIWPRILMIMMIVLVCLSRCELGVHYPTDVMAGILIGIVTIRGMDVLVERYGAKRVSMWLLILGAAGFLFCKSDDYYTGYGILTGAILGSLFEEKYVNFENTTDIVEIMIRVLISLSIFGLMYVGLKLPFPKEFLSQATFCSFLVRYLRYTLMVFAEIGLVPYLFRYIRVGKKNVNNT